MPVRSVTRRLRPGGGTRERVAHDVLRLIFAHLIGRGRRLARELLRDEHPRHDDQNHHDKRRESRGGGAVLGDVSQHPRVQRPGDDRQRHAPGDRRQQRVREKRAQREQHDGECGQGVWAEPLAGRERTFFPNDGRSFARGAEGLRCGP